MSDKIIFENFKEIFDTDNKKDNYLNSNISLTIGVVVDTDDPLQMNRLRIFCPSLNDDPKKLQHLPWAAYVSPFGGVINNTCFTRGSDPDNCKTTGAVHYGFWGTIEQGAHALVGCIDGDQRRRFWMGAFPAHQEANTLFNGRFTWNSPNGTPDGPLSSSGDRIQPLYDNLTESFRDRTSREWKTRGADFQVSALDMSEGQTPNSKNDLLDEQYDQISAAEPDQWVKDILGSHGYDWTAFKNLGGILTSKVFGMTTPGFHTLMMDDRPFNSRIKIRSTHGHMLLMDDTNERIYLATNKGNNWIEMDSAGNIDIYTSKRLSVHAESDINFSTEETFRVKAKKGIYMYSGDTPDTLGSEIPPNGQIRMHSSNDFHAYSDKNIRIYANETTFMQSVNNFEVKSNNWVQEITSNFNIKSLSDINLIASNSIIFNTGSNSLQINTLAATIKSSGSTFEVSSSNIVSNASNDVFLKSGSVNGSINGINTTFLGKQNGGGSPLTPTTTPETNNISPPSIIVNDSETEISIWTNRVPDHEPWPRGMKQSSDKPQNLLNNGYLNNVGWTDQYDNITSPSGMQPIGRVEGDIIINRGKFWRR